VITPDLAQAVLDAALAGGGEHASLFAERTVITSLRLDGGRLEEATGGIDSGVGLAVLHGEEVLFANSNRVDPDGLVALAGRLAGAVGKERQTGSRSMEPTPMRLVSPVTVPPREVNTKAKVALLRRAETAARRHDTRIAQVTGYYRDAEQSVWTAGSEGRFGTDRRTYVTLQAVVVAREGGRAYTGVESASETRGFEFFEMVLPESVGREAARLAIHQLSARPAPAGTFKVVLSSSAGGTMIHEACGHGLEADFIEKGMSVYAGKIGEKVASELITVVDDGTLPNRRGSASIDDEGTGTSRTVLIDNGVLRGFLHSRRTARRMRMGLTGNGRRESYRHLPLPRMRNTMILPGGDDPAGIVSGVEDGILVCRMGGGEVDVATGNFVFNCSEAYRIRNGEIAEPLRDATLIGNGPEILKTVDAVASDLGFGVGTCGKEGQGVPVSDAQPTLRIPGIVVGGTGEGPRPAAEEP
jgi:TldD protein